MPVRRESSGEPKEFSTKLPASALPETGFCRPEMPFASGSRGDGPGNQFLTQGHRGFPKPEIGKPFRRNSLPGRKGLSPSEKDEPTRGKGLLPARKRAQVSSPGSPSLDQPAVKVTTKVWPPALLGLPM
jgi:hypothetical protein